MFLSQKNKPPLWFTLTKTIAEEEYHELIKAKRELDKIKKSKKKNKAPSAFNLFFQEEMLQLREQYPDTSIKELFRLAAEKWAEKQKEGKMIVIPEKEYLELINIKRTYDNTLVATPLNPLPDDVEKRRKRFKFF